MDSVTSDPFTRPLAFLTVTVDKQKCSYHKALVDALVRDEAAPENDWPGLEQAMDASNPERHHGCFALPGDDFLKDALGTKWHQADVGHTPFCCSSRVHRFDLAASAYQLKSLGQFIQVATGYVWCGVVDFR